MLKARSTHRKVECSKCSNVNCPVKKCAPQWLSFINEGKSTRMYKKGQYIFSEGSPVSGIYFIQKGKVKVLSTGLAHKEQIVRLATDGNILGHRGYRGETYPIAAVALEDSCICFCNNDILLCAFESNFEFLYSIMMYYSDELQKSEIRTKYLSQMTVEEKVAFALLYLVDTFGTNPKDRSININLKRTELSALVGTNAGQVSRALTSLKEEGIIQTKAHNIYVLNYEKLKEVIFVYTNSLF